MSMERRALLAFVASMLLFLAYDALYLSPKNKKIQEARRIEMEREAAIADSLAALAPAPAQLEQSDTRLEPYQTSADTAAGVPASATEAGEFPTEVAAPATYVTVACDLYEITLSSAGGEIVSTRLLGYLTEGRPVELFPQDPDWIYERAYSVRLEGAKPLALTDIAFDAYTGASPDPLLDGSRVEVDARRGHTDVVFRAATPDGRVLERSYRFYSGRYDFETAVRYRGSDFPGVESIIWGFGPGLTSTESNVADDQQNFRASIQLGEEFHRRKPGDFSKKAEESYQGTLSWATLQTKYFLAAIVPSEPTRADVRVFGDKAGHRVSQAIALPAPATPGEVVQTVRGYLGPLDYKTLRAIDGDLAVPLDKTIEMGWRFIRPVSWIVLRAMVWMHGFIPNYGWVIIIISVLTKVLFYRLTHKSFKSMKEMQELQPRLAALKEKYGDDRQKLSQETMKLYKEAGVNPLGGCLPMLLQMPVFVALFNVLKFTIEVRGAHFVGWIDDLSQQEVLFRLPISLPFLGDAFSLLPILMGASMFAQSKLGGSPTGGPSTTTPPGFQTMLPIVFTVLFYKMPSGLVLYWIINTVLSVAQQYYIHRDSNTSKENTPEAPTGKRGVKTKER